jgi:hypothetical protein
MGGSIKLRPQSSVSKLFGYTTRVIVIGNRLYLCKSVLKTLKSFWSKIIFTYVEINASVLKNLIFYT